MRLAFMVQTFDAFEFLWDGWYHCFKKYWDIGTPADLFFANEEKDVDYPLLKQIKTGKGQWGARMLSALEQIPNDHVLYMQEDYWLKKRMPAQGLSGAYNALRAHDMDAIKFMLFGSHLNTYRDSFVPQYPRFRPSSSFLCCHTPTIWNKKIFIKTIGSEDTPWQNESNAATVMRNLDRPPRIFMVPMRSRWGEAVHSNARRGRKAKSPSLKGHINPYGQDVLKEMGC